MKIKLSSCIDFESLWDKIVSEVFDQKLKDIKIENAVNLKLFIDNFNMGLSTFNMFLDECEYDYESSIITFCFAKKIDFKIIKCIF